MVPKRSNRATGWLEESLGAPDEFARRCGALKGKCYLYYSAGQLREIAELVRILHGLRGRCRQGEVASIYEDLYCSMFSYLTFEAFNKGCYREHARLSLHVLDILNEGDTRRSLAGEEPWGNTEVRLLVSVHLACGFLEAPDVYNEQGWDSRSLHSTLCKLCGRLHSALSRPGRFSAAASQSLLLCLAEGWLGVFRLDLLHGVAHRRGYLAAIRRECGVKLPDDALAWSEGCDHLLALEYALARELAAQSPNVEAVWQILAIREQLQRVGLVGRPQRVHDLELRRLARLLQDRMQRKGA